MIMFWLMSLSASVPVIQHSPTGSPRLMRPALMTIDRVRSIDRGAGDVCSEGGMAGRFSRTAWQTRAIVGQDLVRFLARMVRAAFSRVARYSSALSLLGMMLLRSSAMSASSSLAFSCARCAGRSYRVMRFATQSRAMAIRVS